MLLFGTVASILVLVLLLGGGQQYQQRQRQPGTGGFVGAASSHHEQAAPVSRPRVAKWRETRHAIESLQVGEQANYSGGDSSNNNNNSSGTASIASAAPSSKLDSNWHLQIWNQNAAGLQMAASPAPPDRLRRGRDQTEEPAAGSLKAAAPVPPAEASFAHLQQVNTTTATTTAVASGASSSAARLAGQGRQPVGAIGREAGAQLDSANLEDLGPQAASQAAIATASQAPPPVGGQSLLAKEPTRDPLKRRCYNVRETPGNWVCKSVNLTFLPSNIPKPERL